MKRIFLLGYMGSGKTTLGKQVAKKLDYEFVDLDEYIEKSYRKTIPEIFEQEGENKFRELETIYLKDFLEKENIVISTGGGTPCFNDNIKLMNDSGITIYFNMDVDILVNRLKGAKEQRPLIKDKSNSELAEFISSTLNVRNSYYKQARLIFTDRNLKATTIIEKLNDLNLKKV